MIGLLICILVCATILLLGFRICKCFDKLHEIDLQAVDLRLHNLEVNVDFFCKDIVKLEKKIKSLEDTIKLYTMRIDILEANVKCILESLEELEEKQNDNY